MSSQQIEQDKNGNMFLWGSQIRLRNFDKNKFDFIIEFIADVWACVERHDLMVAKSSISVHKNHIGIVALPDKEFAGVYTRAKIVKCSKCDGAVKAICISRHPNGIYEQAIFQGNNKSHEFGCEYYIVQNIMEM